MPSAAPELEMMGESPQDTAVAPLRVYRPPWKGEVVFACEKCQRKIKKRGGPKALAKIGKWFRRRSRKDASVTVIDIPCVDLCPKGGVTIFPAYQLAEEPAGVHIAWTEDDLERIYRNTIAK